MPAHPILMVLYTNDAVEVRYTDGSRLHVLPCGTSFSYHVPQDAHPIHGKAKWAGTRENLSLGFPTN